MTNDPTVTTLDPKDSDLDEYYIKDNLAAAAKAAAERIPVLYQDALAEHPAIRDWVATLIDSTRQSDTPNPLITTGPSILILGPIGTGKTHQAFGAIRALSVSGAGFTWRVLTASDLYSRLRPRPHIDSEAEFRKLADTPVLVLDDLGAAKDTEWTEEVNYRIINHRYQWCKPTIFTSNVPPQQLGIALGQRVASRLTQMTTPVVLAGTDRRREERP